MLELLKKADTIKIHLDSKKGYFVVDNVLTSFNLEDIDDISIVNYIINNGEYVKYESNINSVTGDIFRYGLHNGGDYELAEFCDLYSFKFFNDEEFKEMCEIAQNDLKREYEANDHRCRDIYYIASKLRQLYPDIFLKIGCAAGFCTNEW